MALPRSMKLLLDGKWADSVDPPLTGWQLRSTDRRVGCHRPSFNFGHEKTPSTEEGWAARLRITELERSRSFAPLAFSLQSNLPRVGRLIPARVRLLLIPGR